MSTPTSAAPSGPSPGAADVTRQALRDAASGFQTARSELGNLRGQQIREEADAFLSLLSSGVAYSSAREQARALTADLRDQLAEAEARADIWRVTVDALIATLGSLPSGPPATST